MPKRAHVFAFTVRARDDVYHLECASESERQRWLRTLRTAATSARAPPDAAAEAAAADAAARGDAAPATPRDALVPTTFDVASIGELVGDAGLFHRTRWLESLNSLLASERMLANINGALRGVYVVESIDLEFVEEAKIAIAAAGLRPEPRPKADAGGEPPPRSHRLSLDLRWPQQLRCRVRGYRPAGGGLPPFLRSAAKQLAAVWNSTTGLGGPDQT